MNPVRSQEVMVDVDEISSSRIVQPPGLVAVDEIPSSQIVQPSMSVWKVVQII